VNGPARRALVLGAVGTVALGAVRAPRAAARAPMTAELLEALRAGGCVVLMRHAATVPGTGDPPGFRLGDCSTQRNLSDAGREQARRIGRLFRDARVPVGPVRSSRWCRCLDTARLAFGHADHWPALDSFFADAGEGPARTATVRTWALAFTGLDNAVLVTHQVNVTALTGEWVAQGEALVLAPRGGGVTLLGRFVA
jgi:phosphohistidine phosphatase SixA